jgi:hypothetical protein
MIDQALWIWPAEIATGENLYVEFRHEFEVTAAELAATGVLAIGADSQYAVWLNGIFVGTGQYTGFPDHGYYDHYPVGTSLCPGRNVLTVLAHACGVDHFSYIPGRPGLIYALCAGGQKLLGSGAGAVARPSPAYRQAGVPRLTGQLPFNFEYTATADDGWRAADYAGGAGWRLLGTADCLPPEQARRFAPLPIPHWQVMDRVPVRVIAQGVFRLATGPAAAATGVAARMFHDFLSSRTLDALFQEPGPAPAALDTGTGTPLRLRPDAADGTDGVYVVIDLGREDAGFLELDVTAAPGTVIDLAHGEQLDSLRVRSSVGGRCFASRYHCRQGRQSFTHWAVRAGARYLQLHVSGTLDGFALHYAGLRPAVYPVERRGAFHSPDRLANQIFDTAARTLQLCMHEHYEDCPWREQGLYANDSLIQAICGYYAFGEYAFPAFSFRLLGESLREDGWLELCAPARPPITIPSFCMAWVVELEHHLRHSGDPAPATAMLPRVTRMLDGWTAQIHDGLLPCPTGTPYWHFYDWMPGLHGLNGPCTNFQTLSDRRYDAPLNAWFMLALEAGATLAETGGDAPAATRWRQTAAAVRQQFHPRFWQPETACYTSYVGTDIPADAAPAELTQALALCAGACPDAALAAALRQRLTSDHHGLTPASLSQSFHTLVAVAGDPACRRRLLDRIANAWGGMLYQGATAFWETGKGGWDFDCAGSLCHGWSALPAYAWGAWLLGIRPLTPGFTRFTVDPEPGLCANTSGTVPTPHGPITVAWRRDPDGQLTARLAYPPALTPVPAPGIRVERA